MSVIHVRDLNLESVRTRIPKMTQAKTTRSIWTIKNLKVIAMNRFLRSRWDTIVRNFIHLCQRRASLLFEKVISDGTLMDTWGHEVVPGLRYFKGNFLKHVRSQNMSFEKTRYLADVFYRNTWRIIWYLCGNR